MTREERDLVRRDPAAFVPLWGRFWSKPTPEEARTFADPDIVGYWPGLPAPIHGVDEYARNIGEILRHFPDLHLEVTASAANADLVFISWNGATHPGGRELQLRGIDRFRLRDGLVIESVIAYDTAPIVTALARASIVGLARRIF